MKSGLILFAWMWSWVLAQGQRLEVATSTLDKVRTEHQKLRDKSDSLKRVNARPEEVKRWSDSTARKNSTNIAVIARLLDENGWMGPDKIGKANVMTVIHLMRQADVATQEKYLPMLKSAGQQGMMRAEDVAVIEDRVAISKGQKQVYGTQIAKDMKTGEYSVAPIDNPNEVDQRRALVGLGPMRDYVKKWNIKWKP
ncbi:MAG: hypothetical protein K2U26_00785 [Cyclobacteriaceae bacterium]|nr:hypothetical protein [Cyclobacteriaceae bacterium]